MVGGAIALVALAVVGVAMSGRMAARSSMGPAIAAPVAPPANAEPAANADQAAAAAYAIPSEVKDEVSASLPRRAPVERAVAAAPAEARAVEVRQPVGARKVAVAPVRGKHPATRPEPPRAATAHAAGAALPLVDAPPPAPSEPKKRAQLVDDQSRVKLLE